MEEMTTDPREDRDGWQRQATTLLETNRPKGFLNDYLGSDNQQGPSCQ